MRPYADHARQIIAASVLVACVACSDPLPPPAATQLLFVAQPASAVAGATLAPTVTVAVLDATGDIVTGSTAIVSLSISSGAVGASLAGSTTAAAVAGVATFSGLSIAKAGTAFTLRATSPGLSDANSSSFDIAAGAVATLSLTAGSGQSGVVGRQLPDTLRVTALDGYGNPVTAAPLTWSVGSGGGTLIYAQAVADGTGTARAVWRLGPTSGTQQVVATSGAGTVTISSTAQPLSLLALRAVAPSSLEFARLNSATAAIALSVPRPEITSTMQGQSALDSAGGRYFVFNGTLRTIATATGAVLASVVADVNEIQFDPASQSLVGLTSRTGTQELVRVNPQTGAISSIGFVPSLLGTNQGSASFDAATGRYFVVAIDTSFVERLYSLSATTATVLANPAISAVGVSGTRFDPVSGTLVGLSFRTGVEELVRVAPATGAVISSGLIPEVQSSTQGEASLDPSTGLYAFLGYDGSTARVYVVSIASAAIISKAVDIGLSYLQFLP